MENVGQNSIAGRCGGPACQARPISGTLTTPPNDKHNIQGVRGIVRIRTFAVCLLLAGSSAFGQYTQPVDPRSYNLGIIGGFAEVVHRGVKKLALSEVMTPAEMDDILPDAMIVADRNGVLLYRETDLIVTDLFPSDVATGKHVLLIYTGDTLSEYLALKDDKARLIAADQYRGQARTDIARRFGRLLSYPDAVVEDMLTARAGSITSDDKN